MCSELTIACDALTPCNLTPANDDDDDATNDAEKHHKRARPLVDSLLHARADFSSKSAENRAGGR